MTHSEPGLPVAREKQANTRRLLSSRADSRGHLRVTWKGEEGLAWGLEQALRALGF